MNKFKTTLDHQPETDFILSKSSIDDGTWSQLANNFNTLLTVHRSARATLDDTLQQNNALYEMRASILTEDNVPVPGSPTMMVPFIPCEVDEFTSRIAGTAILPRPLLIRGNDPSAASQAHVVEQMYNNKWEEKKYERDFRTCIHLAARDGTSVMGVFWKHEVVERLGKVRDPQDPTGKKRISEKVRMTTYDDPKLYPIELADFMLIPAYSKSIEEAGGVSWRRYMNESTLKSMVREGSLRDDMVERALNFVMEGQGELSYDQNGTTASTYTISDQINITDTAIAPPAGIKMSRGPLWIEQVHTNMYDMDGDGVEEENIFWFHSTSMTLLGWEPYEYMGPRPFFAYAPYSRPNRFYGFGIPERLQALQQEADVQELAQLAALDKIINSTYLRKKGANIVPEEQKIGALNVITVADENDLTLLKTPIFPEFAMQVQEGIVDWGKRLTGAPQVGGSPSPSGSVSQTQGRQSARAASQIAVMQGMQTNMIIKDTRDFMLDIFQFMHILMKQYGPDQHDVIQKAQEGVTKVLLPREVMSLDFTLSVAGQGGPLDKETRRQEMQAIFPLLMQCPLTQGDLGRVYEIYAKMLEVYEFPEVTQFIGTKDEALQKMQQQAEAAKAQQEREFQLAAIEHSKVQSSGQGHQQQ